MVYLTKEEMAALTYHPKDVESSAFLVTNVGMAASGIVSSILTAFAGATLDGLKPRIVEYLGRNLSLAITLSATDISKIDEQIEAVLDLDYKNIIDLAKGGIGQGVGGIHASFYEQLNGVNALMAGYVGLIQKIGIDPYISRWVNTTIRPNIPDARTAWFLNLIGELADSKYREYYAQCGWGDEFRTPLEMAWTRAIPEGMILDLERRGVIDALSTKYLLKWHGYSTAWVDLIEGLSIQMPEPYRTADFAAKRLITDAQNREAFKWVGLSASWADTWKESQLIRENWGQLFEMRWRGVIDDNAFTAIAEKVGYEAGTIVRMKALLEQIPPSQDLVTMVVREAWEPENITPAPDIFAKYMLMRGFSKDWSDRYWTAHWLPMPIQYAYDNLRRGYWTKEKFMDLLRIADLHPRWREDIYNVAFNPPSIREMGYGYDVGVYKIEDIVRFRRWGGLSEEDAAKAGQAMVAYRTEAEREAIRRDLLRLYVNGNTTRESFDASLKMVGTNPQAVQLWLTRGDLEIQLKSTETSVTEPKNVTRSDVQWLFENGLRGEDWFKSTLKMIGYSDSSIQAYLDQSKKRIADKVKPPKVAVKELSLADLRVAFRNDVISEATFRYQLALRGYEKAWVDILVNIELSRKPTPPAEKIPEITPAMLSMLFRKGIIDEAEYRSELSARKYTAVDINRIVELDKARMLVPPPEVKYRELTLSQIQRLLKLELFTKDEAIAAIQALDYTASDASLIYQIMSANVYVEPEPRMLTDAHVTSLYDYNLVSESDILVHFKAEGYSDADARLLTQLAVITKNLPDLKDMYGKGWINQMQLFEGVKALGIPMETIEPSEYPKLSKLIEVIGLPDEKAKRIMLTIVKAEQPMRTAAEKDLTKAEIVKGVKVGVISPVEGVSLLEGIGYDENEAWYILAINKVVSAGDPEGYWDMRRVTELAKKARGQPSVEIPQELVTLDKQRKDMLANINKLKADKAPEEEIGKAAVALANVESRMHTIISKLKLA
jgi:hypothetical protein